MDSGGDTANNSGFVYIPLKIKKTNNRKTTLISGKTFSDSSGFFDPSRIISAPSSNLPFDLLGKKCYLAQSVLAHPVPRLYFVMMFAWQVL